MNLKKVMPKLFSKKKMSLQVFVTAKSTASILIDPTCEQRSEF